VSTYLSYRGRNDESSASPLMAEPLSCSSPRPRTALVLDISTTYSPTPTLTLAHRREGSQQPHWEAVATFSRAKAYLVDPLDDQAPPPPIYPPKELVNLLQRTRKSRLQRGYTCDPHAVRKRHQRHTVIRSPLFPSGRVVCSRHQDAGTCGSYPNVSSQRCVF